MGECSFGRGFGQTKPAAEIERGVSEKVWKSIPRSIFDGLSKRYQVSDFDGQAKRKSRRGTDSLV